MRTLHLPVLLAAAALVAVDAVAEIPAHLAALPPGALAIGPAPSLAAASGMAKPGERLGLWLPGGHRAFEVESVQRFEDGVESRSGRLAGGGHALLTLGREGGFARVVDGPDLWFLEVRDGATYAVKAGRGGLALAADDEGAVELATRALAAPTAAKASAVAAKAPAGWTVIDLLQVHDADFAARYPGGLTATRLAHLVALANQAFVDSGIKAVLRVVGLRSVTGVLAGDISSNLEQMAEALQFRLLFNNLDLLQLRNELGADLIALHRVHDLLTRGACGIAYFPSRTSDTYGVSVTNDGASHGSLCDDLVLAHEIAHNLGARHNIEADPTPGRNHGYARSGRFITIMGSFGTGHPDRYLRLGMFSNPRMACGGMPCGQFDVADNAGAISDNLAWISGYRGSRSNAVANPPAQSEPDSDGDGIRDRLDAFPFDATRSADRDQDGVADADDAFPDNASEWHDADGGGLGDQADADDDNDGVPDGGDAFPYDPNESSDGDGDGVGDLGDALPLDPAEDRDSDLDGAGDRADPDDDDDGTIDLGSGATTAESELLVADGASDRILRFRGSDLAALPALVQLDEHDVSSRSGMAAAPSGELWYVAGSSLWRHDRLRGERRRMVDAFAQGQIRSGFPLSPVLVGTDAVAFAELATARVFSMSRTVPALSVYALGSSERVHLAAMPDGRVIGMDGNSGNLTRFRYEPLVAGRLVVEQATGSGTTGLRRPVGGAVAVDGSLYVVESSDGSIRRLDALGGLAPIPGFSAAVGAISVAVAPDGTVHAGLVGGGVRRLDPATGADLGLVVSAASAPEPLALLWVPRVVDADLAPRAPPATPTGSDPGVTPATGGPAPQPPPDPLAPCLSGCGDGGGGGGGAPDALLALLASLLLLKLERRQLLLHRRVA